MHQSIFLVDAREYFLKKLANQTSVKASSHCLTQDDFDIIYQRFQVYLNQVDDDVRDINKNICGLRADGELANSGYKRARTQSIVGCKTLAIENYEAILQIINDPVFKNWSVLRD